MVDPNVVTQFTGAATIVWVIQELKKAGWCKSIDFDTTKINRMVSALAALATGAAIHWNWDAATHALTISGLTATAILSFLWGAAQQFVGQEMIYQVVYAPKGALKEAAAKADIVQKITVARAANVVADAIDTSKSETP